MKMINLLVQDMTVVQVSCLSSTPLFCFDDVKLSIFAWAALTALSFSEMLLASVFRESGVSLQETTVEITLSSSFLHAPKEDLQALKPSLIFLTSS